MRMMFERSDETDKIIGLFQTIAVGHPISHAEASRRVGFQFDASTSAYQSACAIAAKKHNIVIETVRAFGFVRLDASSIVDRGGKHLRSIRRRAHRAGHEMEIAISGNLERAQMMKATEQLSRFRITESTAQPVRASTNRVPLDVPEPAKPADARAAFARS